MQNRNLTLLTVSFMSALARAQGLHGAIVRETRQSNPHAVFALMRSYAQACGNRPLRGEELIRVLHV